MEPLIPNSPATRCGNPVSSNCVTWQGGSVCGIEICNGDTISDIAIKLGNLSCFIGNSIDLTKLDLSCIYTPCPSCQSPTNLVDVLQVIVNYLCTIKTTVNQINTAIAQLGGTPPANI
jgi:hypothetical protein